MENAEVKAVAWCKNAPPIVKVEQFRAWGLDAKKKQHVLLSKCSDLYFAYEF